MSPQDTRVILNNHIPSGYLKELDFSRDRITGTKDSYVDSYVVGQTITNYLVGTVVSSTSTGIKEGDIILHDSGKWESEFIVDAKDLNKLQLKAKVDSIDFVGVLSMASYSAYYGLIAIGKPKAGEAILVSSASGAVGQMAVQIERARGLKDVAVAGSDNKVEFVKSFGAAVVFNYKACGDYTEAIKKAAPEGIDIYFENVGGPFLDAVLANINPHGRVILCGAITQYNISSPDQVYGVKNFTAILIQKVTVQGFIIFDYFNTQIHNGFFNEMSQLYKKGKIQYKIDVTEGLDNAPRAILDLYEGKNFGKSIIKA